MQLPVILRKLFRRRIVLAAAIALVVVVLVSMFAGPLSGLDPNETAIAQRHPSIAYGVTVCPAAQFICGASEKSRSSR